MYSPGRFELLVGVLFTIPGVITAVLVEELPMRTLIDPGVVATGIVGAIWNGDLLLLGLSLLYLLYFVGVVAILVSLVSIVRDRSFY